MEHILSKLGIEGRDASVPKFTEGEYRKAFGLSQSQLKDFIFKSPAHYLQSTQEEKEPTPAMQFGTAFHSEMLQDKPKDFYAVKLKMDGRTKDGKAYNEAFDAENAGKAIINTDDEIKIKHMRESILRHPFARKLTEAITFREFPVFGTAITPFNLHEVRLKGLIDGYCKEQGFVIDYKSCEDASPKGFKKAVKEFKYDLQNIQYPWLLTNAKIPVNKFYFICVEKVPPYAVGVYWISDRNLLESGMRWAKSLEVFGDCEAKGMFPAYSDEAVELDLWD